MAINMQNLIRIIKEQKLILDIINVVIGILTVILAVIYFLHPKNYGILISVLLLAGTVNVLNGVKRVKDHNNKASIGFFVVGAFVYLMSAFLLFQF
ncbi:hypothetical protein [Anaerocolumna xylanovorans]|uniref:Uncharacterized protein n=1 Tax=Anaerocolumna xylanovorans DSM 12503 TaxID=1121345 RepID=A0A1M7YN64_9FIRM|nr:hypothetical protein [Anaerocolumna xylanovorans]SHO54074.1 hypothetical protein SAMN02745217_04513 [Anaerocolumna xylanovorans DSM 12503]